MTAVTITTSYPNGITLTNAAYDPVTIAAGTNITNAAGPALGSSLPVYWTLSNFGVIRATGTSTNSLGIGLPSGALITNQTNATIGGYGAGVSLTGSGAVVNNGTITAGQTAGHGYSYSSYTHTLTPLSAAVILAGGGVANAASGLISGYFEGVAISGGGSVTNAGHISASSTKSGFGVVLAAGGGVSNASNGTITGGVSGIVSVGTNGATLNNQGAITGLYDGMLVTAGAAATVTNAGSFIGTAQSGIVLDAGGTVNNSAAGTISGGYFGIQASGAAASVTNLGSIASARVFTGANGFDAAGVALVGGGTVTNARGANISAKWIGVQIGTTTANATGTVLNQGTVFASDGTNGAALWLHGSTTVDNEATGTIAGGPYAIVSYAQMTLVNRGTISGTQWAVDPVNAGFANRIIVSPGAVFSGTVSGGNTLGSTIVSTLELASGASTGTISGFNSQYINFGQVLIDAGAAWSLNGTVAASQTLAFGGTNAALTLTSPRSMAGTVAGFSPGDTIALAGITDVTGTTLTGGNVLTIQESSGSGLSLRLDPAQSFASDNFHFAASGTGTNLTLSLSPTASAITNAYTAILRTAPSQAYVSQETALINGGSLTLAALETQLLGTAQAQNNTIPALLSYDFVYGATPASSGLDYLSVYAADLQSGNYTYTGGFQLGTTPGQYNLPQFSVLNTYVNLCATGAIQPGNPFNQTYGSLAATVSAANRTTFFNQVYTSIFGHAPDAGTTNHFINDPTPDPLNPGQQVTVFQFYVEYAGSELGAYGAIAGVLLWTAENASPQLGSYPPAVTAFLTAAANGTVSYGPELLRQFPPASAQGTIQGTSVMMSGGAETMMASVPVTPVPTVVAPDNGAVIAISSPDQLIDPGAGNHTIQFLAGAHDDTLVLHTGGVDQVSGFDPGTDVLDLSALLREANVSLNGDPMALGHYVTVTDQGSNALVGFDPAGHGGGSTVAVLQGLGSVVTELNMLLTRGGQTG